MIKAAIKIGPNDWFKRLEKSSAHFTEIWYRVDKPNWYEEHFTYCHKHNIRTGLHYWGSVDDTWETNIAYPGHTLEKSLALIKSCLDVAAKNSCTYVNIHCGNRQLIKIDLLAQTLRPDDNSQPINESESAQIQRQSLIELNAYAKKVGVLLLVETVPAKISSSITWDDKSGRLKPVQQFALPVKHLIDRATTDGINITNDFCHTFADTFDQPRQTLKEIFWEKTQALVPHTKLIHISTVEPPFNGTDSHHGILASDFAIDDIFPNQTELTKLLSLYKDRSDVWALVEPSSNHEQNYVALKNLLETL